MAKSTVVKPRKVLVLRAGYFPLEVDASKPAFYGEGDEVLTDLPQSKLPPWVAEIAEDSDLSAVETGIEAPQSLNEEHDILQAVARLDPENDDHWTSNDLPSVSAVNKFMKNGEATRALITSIVPGMFRSVKH